jgi:S-adenosylmethionine uptake transporter
MSALWMIVASFLFASMGVCVKFASADFNSMELVFYRGVIGVASMGLIARVRGVSLRTDYLSLHAWRSVIGVLSLSAWFYAIAHLPLPTAMTLNYMSSIWVAAFLVGGALMFGRGAAQGSLVLTIVAGFVGVVMLLRPTLAADQSFAGLIGLLSGIGAAFAYMQIMALARLGEPDERTVFFFACGTVVAGLIGMAVLGVSPWRWQAAVWLVPIGLLASIGQLCMTRAYNHGATLVVANLQYSGIVFSVIYSLVLFGDHIPAIGWVGMALIVCSGIAATILRTRAVPDAPSDEL